MSDNIVKLEHPIPADVKSEHQGKINELVFGRLKAKHLKLFPASFFSGGGADIAPTDFLPIIAGLANIPEESADEIDFADLIHVVEMISDYLGKLMPQSQ